VGVQAEEHQVNPSDSQPQDRREVAVITGGRDRTPTLAELEQLEVLLAGIGARVVRHGACPPKKNARGELVGSTDTLVAGYLRARGWDVESWPADWKRHGRPAGPIRNRDMISGRRPGQLVPDPRADVVIAFEGGAGTLDCRVAGYEAGLVVHHIWAVAEPRPWNSHHGTPPGPALYCGRPSPAGNPFKFKPGPDESRADAVVASLASYRAWLRGKITAGPDFDRAVVDYLEQLTPAHYAVCSCWPAHCHVEVVIKAWRWLRRRRK